MNKVLIVEAVSNQDVTDTISIAVRTTLEQYGVDYERVQLPSIFEIPAAMSIALEAFDYDGLIAVGAINMQEDAASSIMFKACVDGVNEIAIHFSIPTGFGVMMIDGVKSSIESAQALGKKAAEGCLELIKIRNLYQSFHGETGSGYKN